MQNAGLFRGFVINWRKRTLFIAEAALDDLERAVTDTETEAEAWEELSGDATTDLEEKYGTGGDADVEEELAALVAARGKD